MSESAIYQSQRGGYDPIDSRDTEETPEQTEETPGPAEETAPLGSPHELVETTPWAYGPPATAPRESNFISDENLLLWLAQKQDGMYGELRDNMDMSRERSKLMEDLAHIKERVDNGASTPEEVYAEMTALFEAYAGTPLGAELVEAFGPMFDKLGRALESNNMFSVVDQMDAVKGFSDTIESKIDALGRDDQLALIQIQSLTADIREAAQLASNLLSSSNQAANSIVGNIAR